MEATWEDIEPLKQKFPRAPTWEQAGNEWEGNVSDQGGNQGITSEAEAQDQEVGRPKRERRRPAWFDAEDWLT